MQSRIRVDLIVIFIFGTNELTQVAQKLMLTCQVDCNFAAKVLTRQHLYYFRV